MGNRWREVSSIEEQWGFDLWLMSRPMTRTYYRVRGEDGAGVTLFRDERNGCWYRQSAPRPDTPCHDLPLRRASPEEFLLLWDWVRPIAMSY